MIDSQYKFFLSGHKPFEKHFLIKFKDPVVRQHENGFISVTLDWVSRKGGEEGFWKFKYPQLTHTKCGGVAVYKTKKYIVKNSAAFEFPNLTDNDFEHLPMASWFDVCFGVETEDVYMEQLFEYIFHENTKFGMIVWFAPKGWEGWESALVLKQ